MLTSFRTDSGALLETIVVEPEGWLVRDCSFGDGDARAIIGFAQETDRGFDVVWLTPHPSSEFIAHLDQFFDAAAARCARLDRR